MEVDNMVGIPKQVFYTVIIMLGTGLLGFYVWVQIKIASIENSIQNNNNHIEILMKRIDGDSDKLDAIQSCVSEIKHTLELKQDKKFVE